MKPGANVKPLENVPIVNTECQRRTRSAARKAKQRIRNLKEDGVLLIKNKKDGRITHGWD